MVEVDQEAPVHVRWLHEPALAVVADASAQPAVLEVRANGAFILNESGQAGIGLIPGKRIVNVDVRETALGMVQAIGFPAQLLETKALPDLPDLLVNRITIFGRPMDLVAKRARHAEPDEPDVLACDLDHARASQLDVLQLAFGGTLKNLQRPHAVEDRKSTRLNSSH